MLHQAKILIADDSGSMRSMLKAALVKVGFTNFTEVENGQLALQRLRQDDFDLVISDWEMPQMNGMDMLREIRFDETLHKLPFIMVSSISDATKVITAIEEGVDDYVIKPLKPDNFAHRVMDVLNNKNKS